MWKMIELWRNLLQDIEEHFSLGIPNDKRTISHWLQGQLTLAADSHFFYIGFLLEDP